MLTQIYTNHLANQELAGALNDCPRASVVRVMLHTIPTDVLVCQYSEHQFTQTFCGIVLNTEIVRVAAVRPGAYPILQTALVDKENR